METATVRQGVLFVATLALMACGSGGTGGTGTDGGTGGNDGGSTMMMSGGDLVCPMETIPDNTTLLGYQPPTPPSVCQSQTNALVTCLRAIPNICGANGKIDTMVLRASTACAMQAMTAQQCGACAVFNATMHAFRTQPTVMGMVISGTINEVGNNDPSCVVLNAMDMPVTGATCNVNSTGPDSSDVVAQGPGGAALPSGTYRLRVTLRSRLGATEMECPSKTITSMPFMVP